MSKNTDVQTRGKILVEWAPFKPAPGVTEADLLAASDAMERDFLAKQRGYIRRELLKARDGQWADLVYWEDQDAADQAMNAVGHSQACAAYFRRMDGVSQETPALHFETVKSYVR